MNVIRTFSHKALFPVLILVSCCVTLPAFFKSFSLFLLFLVLALSGELFSCKYKLKSILRFDNPLLWLVGLYLLYCVGMLWTKDLKLGFDDLVIKLPMLVVPVLPSECLYAVGCGCMLLLLCADWWFLNFFCLLRL